MPRDQKGNFHNSTQRAIGADKRAGMGKPSKVDEMSPSMDKDPMASEPEPGGVHEHLAAMHAQMGGKHMHVHSDGFNHTTHQVGEDGKVEGPHDHENIDALKEHMGKFLDEEAQEPQEAPAHHGIGKGY